MGSQIQQIHTTFKTSIKKSEKIETQIAVNKIEIF